MIKFDCRNTDCSVVGQENGLDLASEFAQYKDKIAEIIADLNKRKDKPGQMLQWMNLGYNEETLCELPYLSFRSIRQLLRLSREAYRHRSLI